ncbi:cold shock domain-containing protein [Leeuwenhoekiella aequorea]|jgi:cold shock CspA family protein|uniref:Putative cold-shock DNA-binding protein n=1 Tax=Leeuwenhoekiella aequorea TaxID=283736 RepID=A0A4Q0P9M6_9FLAO|nr:cold shock domain-containing protein [Leeuwenhoekiella aequorea]RXG23500.1 putative cold-shock DNA-binding protein [Leeuwenhoekiella aequorea]|tara:strand:- start:35 stop:499 length:465 start_codon:yes stop_codon:yes gene_type:complete
MAKSQQTYSKTEREKKRIKKREEKLKRKEERKANSVGGNFEDMIAYVDHNGNLTDTPPDPSLRVEVDIEDIQISVPKTTEEDKIAAEEAKFRKGKVSFFDHSKGFGFIIDTENQEKYFVHVSGILEGELNENDKVAYELERGQKGMNAVRVTKI